MGHELCHCLGREAPPLDKRAEEAEGGFCGVVLGFCGVSCVTTYQASPVRVRGASRVRRMGKGKERVRCLCLGRSSSGFQFPGS